MQVLATPSPMTLSSMGMLKKEVLELPSKLNSIILREIGNFYQTDINMKKVEIDGELVDAEMSEITNGWRCSTALFVGRIVFYMFRSSKFSFEFQLLVENNDECGIFNIIVVD